MCIDVKLPKSKSKSTNFSMNLLLASLLFVLLVSVLSVCVLTADAIDPIYVGSEDSLRDAVETSKGHTIIALSADIQLSTTFNIASGKDITLTSSGECGFFKLIGLSASPTITVNNGGILELAGIVVTHANGAHGTGVYVNYTGAFTLSDGAISDNTYDYGGGIHNLGSFTMSGGTVSNNTAYGGGGIYTKEGSFCLSGGVISNNTAEYGGGVYIGAFGNFTMFDGEISGNTATYGGGVYNYAGSIMSGGPCSTFMFGGKISNNTATYSGGGLFICDSTFTLFGGMISNNTANLYGGGVGSATFDRRSQLVMFGGTISDNVAKSGGGIHLVRYPDGGGDFTMSGGVISNNIATYGGGIYNNHYHVELFNGLISANTATNNGGGIYTDDWSEFAMFDGEILDNIAGYGGGGIYTDGSFTMSDGTIRNNTATYGAGVYTCDTFTMSNGIISGNTASNSGGGIWVDVEGLNRLFVYDGAVFSNNHASIAYDRAPDHDAVYETHIGANVVWTTPFMQGYNNYDISYTNNHSPTLYAITVYDSYAQLTGTGSCQAGETVTINAGTKLGYTFTGWTINEGGITLPNSSTVSFTMPSNNVIVTANWIKDPVKVIDAIPTAFVTKLNGNKNELTLTITEKLSDGTTNTLTKTFNINNNAADTYTIGTYKIYVDTKGNTQIRACYLTE